MEFEDIEKKMSAKLMQEYVDKLEANLDNLQNILDEFKLKLMAVTKNDDEPPPSED